MDDLNLIEGGHYVAYCKNEVDDNWYEFDDTVVTRLETPDILTKEAYVLFYQKQSTRNMDAIKNRVRQMLEEEFSEKTKVRFVAVTFFKLWNCGLPL